MTTLLLAIAVLILAVFYYRLSNEMRELRRLKNYQPLVNRFLSDRIDKEEELRKEDFEYLSGRIDALKEKYFGPLPREAGPSS